MVVASIRKGRVREGLCEFQRHSLRLRSLTGRAGLDRDRDRVVAKEALLSISASFRKASEALKIASEMAFF